MSIRNMTGNVSYHSSLPDQPTQEASELKEIWDQGVNDLKDYINDTLIPDMLAEFLAKTGGTIRGNLSATGTLTISGATTLNGRFIVSGLATFRGGVAINSSGTANGLEMYGSTPYIDFHFGNSSADYTSRIIEEAQGVLHISSNNGLILGSPLNKIKTQNGLLLERQVVINGGYANYLVNTWISGHGLLLSVDNSIQGYFQLSSSSDKRLKKDIKEIDENVIKAIGEVKLKQFKLKRNNLDNKISFGVIAQELIEAFEKYGLDVNDYSLIDKIEYEDGIEYYIVDYDQFNILRMAYLESKLGG